MLIWAVFTLGYLFGVFFTLAVFFRKDGIEEYSYTNNPVNSENYRNMDQWKIFTQLTKPNYPKSGQTQTIIRQPECRSTTSIPHIIPTVS